VLLDPDRADEALRVAQEAVSNALRHARATEVELTLDASEGTVLLTVTDDGIGPDGDLRRGGWGSVSGRCASVPTGSVGHSPSRPSAQGGTRGDPHPSPPNPILPTRSAP
jgi:hypothetical protein